MLKAKAGSLPELKLEARKANTDPKVKKSLVIKRISMPPPHNQSPHTSLITLTTHPIYLDLSYSTKPSPRW